MKWITVIGIFLLISILVSGKNRFEQETECGLCPWWLYKHYHYKQCELAETDDCGCPKKFTCPTKVSKNDHKVCTYLNIEYGISSIVDVGDPCYICRCIGERNPRIACHRKECRHIQWPNGQNCHPVYEKNKCCPTEFRCVSDLESFVEHNESVCVHENRTYPLGAHIHFLENPCLICTCTENWNGIDDHSCHMQSCPFQTYQRRFDAKCIPIFHENKCCPIEFYCPDIDWGYLENNSIIPQQAAENIDDSCTFGDQQYSLGSELNHTNPCIQCRCDVPPDFTCVHQSCPNAPASEGCVTVYYGDQCCPSYDCNQTEWMPHSNEFAELQDLYDPHSEENLFISTPRTETDAKENEGNEPFSEMNVQRNLETSGGDSDSNTEVEVDASQSENSREIVHRILAIFRRKRSNSNQYQQPEYQQQVYQTHEKDYSEIEREYDFESERNEGVDEIKLIGKNQQSANSRSFNEISDPDPNINWNRVIWTSYVEGCPTPMCANPTCMIGILPGQHCPSCICNYPGTGQP